jgi:hypothetical protein
MKLRFIAMTGVLSLAGLGLIGAGAHAVFTTSTASNQTINAGTPSVVLSSPDAPGCTSWTDYCPSITLNPVGPVGSTFDTPASLVTVTNVGNIPVEEYSFQLSDSNPAGGSASAWLQDEMDVCITSGFSSGGWVVANGPLTTGMALSPSVLFNGPWVGTTATILAPNAAGAASQDSYEMEFYAGQNTADCGSSWSAGGHTASAWSGATYPTVNPWVEPNSLGNEAEGGSVAVTLTLNYEA